MSDHAGKINEIYLNDITVKLLLVLLLANVRDNKVFSADTVTKTF